ncbi:SEL1-like repeat protein [Roseburia hominis]
MKNNKKLKEYLPTVLIEIIVVGISACLTHYFTLKEMQQDYDKMTTYELLYEAYLEHNAGNFGNCINIYKIEKVETNPEAINNMAYMYYKGLGIHADVEKARTLFKEAYETDSKYIDGIVGIEIICPKDITETNEWVNIALREKNEQVQRFVDVLLGEVYPDKSLNSQDYLKLSTKEQVELLESSLTTEYEWNKDTIEDTYFYSYVPGADYMLDGKLKET